MSKHSLSVQLLAGVLLSLFIAVLAFGLFFSLGNALLDHTVYGEGFSEKMADRQFQQLQSYVEKGSVTVDRLSRLNAWCSRGKGVYLTVYRDGTLIYESPVVRVVRAQPLDPDSFDPAAENAEREYSLRFFDGVETRAFLYFLVYTSEWEQPELETRDADELFSQFWQEYAFALENRGFSVETDFGELGGNVAVNLELLRRAFDNLYGNLAKYAEPSEPIVIQYRRMEGVALLTLVNTVSSQRESRESTNIGLNTCRRIMRMLGGSFEAKEDEGVFTAELRLPFSDNNCEETKN